MTNNLSRLDADELFHLAIDIAGRGDHGAAINYLKRSLELNPDDAKVRYFLAAEHAQIGMYERAVKEMEHAVELDPTLYMAHFQLGLLHLTSGHVGNALDAWQALGQLGDSHPLYLFQKGLGSMAGDDLDNCREYLTQGMALNVDNPELNADMQRILDNLPQQESEEKDASQTSHIFLSAYTSENHNN